ncbi:MAG: D-glycero-beta-D-manno-heptose 1-phosphate adenylyltransferase [Candidatus Pacebacteria bacterium CG_4_9_14_3_um_filter_40_12]|nr:MAG: D-glycero-beta-D-manno-heptose 1-phosphate adenylyltransferase [Candidatus Pacebacteria bacterium CG10_big_fil_rev_8_21_14_0_10_40_26]PIZ79161.1 MAG: D-glycero-beta-D-manno-heptose 1-phosphate adenylyltransferase [Candidatus Pacebacteria bacterium CG_4_10_14_0_2_um_filter_40_20]PJA68816.1 MAG: D-glycero-beta-D-manno-heptose 1-phosphate adenylyltransferase [Candidatus Pacebacteria bacterium CG_4_9_14_3_um_filter_40_12]PJC42127.1 MAG: D-glycero-beta-D-manno-heptose 1-phosphate adenylyltran
MVSMNEEKMISSYAQIADLVTTYRKAHKKIVLTQGSFDMLHIGHGRYLSTAKTYGDVLFVGIDSDEKIRSRKGPDRPVVPEDERLEMVTYISAVDHAVIKQLDKPKWELIKIIKPDVLIATRETYSPKKIAELEKICGKVVVLEPMATTSTSAKLRLVQLGMAKKIGKTLSDRMIATMEEVIEELKALR